MIAFIIVFTIINISLWGIFLFKFKKIFSTDSIIEKTKRQVDLIINDMDQNANRDISVLNETLRKIKISLNESEKQMELFKEASNRLKTLISEADKKARSDSNSIIYNDLDSRNAKKVNTRYSDAYLNTSKKVSINPDAAYQVTKKEKSLFDNEDNESKIFNDEINVTTDGAAYKQVPLIITKVMDEKKTKKEDINNDVKKLYEQGYSVEQIALELSCSIIEVQFIIDLL